MMQDLKILVLLLLCFIMVACDKTTDTSQEQTINSANEIDVQPDMEAMLKLGARSYIRCQACHTLGQNQAHGVGPNLYGLFTSKAGTKQAYQYSDALLDSNIEWNEQSLTQWLRSPAAMVPGNKMAFAGIDSDKELAALLVYLNKSTQ